MLFNFGNFSGLYAFLVLIPFIILYLIKPKPSKIKIPSLMFFMKNTHNSKIQSLFRYFQNDLLFLIQLLILALLAFSVSQPSVFLNMDVVSDNIVFVLDVSASSQILGEGNITKLDFAKNKIEDLATSRNSLVLIKSYPVLALEGVSRGELVRYLDKIKPTDDISDISSAISLAGDSLINDKGRVIVLSDFISSKGISVDVVKYVIESRGVPVDFIDTKNKIGSNVGIIDMVIRGEDVNIYIKNYDNNPKTINLKVNEGVNKIELKPLDIEPFVFKAGDNVTKVEILEQDDFLVDNGILITKPYSDNVKVLLISNNPSKYLKAALNSIDGVSVSYTEPPLMPNDDFDVYVIDNLDKNKLVFDNFGSILRRIQISGDAAIIVGQKGIDGINYEGLLPIKFNSYVQGGFSSVQYSNVFTKDIDFGNVKNVFDISFAKEGIDLVKVGNHSVISLFDQGEGKVVYYGILDSESDFKLSPDYPVFWKNLVYYLSGRLDLNEVNLKTGTIFNLQNDSKVLDKEGLYKYGENTISVNLLNERESDINYVDKSFKSTFSDNISKVKAKVDFDLTYYLALVALILLLSELFYIRFRGEI